MCQISRCADPVSVLVVFTCLLVYFCSSQVNISFIEQALCSVSDLWPLRVSSWPGTPPLHLHPSLTLSTVKCGSVTSHADAAFFFSLHISTFLHFLMAPKPDCYADTVAFHRKCLLTLSRLTCENWKISKGSESREGDECYSWKRSTPPPTPPPGVPLTQL